MDSFSYTLKARSLISEYAHIRLFNDEENSLKNLQDVFQRLSKISIDTSHLQLAQLASLIEKLCAIWIEKKVKLNTDLLTKLPNPKIFLDSINAIEHATVEPDLNVSIVAINNLLHGYALKRTTVLLVEDDPLFKQISLDSLRNSPVEVDYAADGEEAIARLSTKEYDCVLLDIIMPKKTGFEVLDYCSEIGIISKTPVIVLSTLGDAVNKEKALAKGAVDFIHKDTFNFSELPAKVSSFINKNLNKQ